MKIIPDANKNTWPRLILQAETLDEWRELEKIAYDLDWMSEERGCITMIQDEHLHVAERQLSIPVHAERVFR
jgi:hypothetical protein